MPSVVIEIQWLVCVTVRLGGLVWLTLCLFEDDPAEWVSESPEPRPLFVHWTHGCSSNPPELVDPGGFSRRIGL